MKAQFEQYLVKAGYSKVTPSGHPSTVYDYLKRIEKVCEWEQISWEELSDKIGNIVRVYDRGGEKEEFGNKSHRAVINALKSFEMFVFNREGID